MRPVTTSFGLIRPWGDGDVEALVKYAGSRAVWRNMRDAFPHPYTVERARAFLALVAGQDPMTYWAIATDREAIGGIGVTLNQDVHRLTAELGYWLGEPFWGRGIMTECVTAFTDLAFDRYGLVRVYAMPYADNAASSRVLEKAGYALEGRLRRNVIKDGRILDSLVYARLKAG